MFVSGKFANPVQRPVYLSKQDIKDIHKAYKSGKNIKDIAAYYNVPVKQIQAVLKIK